MHVLFIVRCWLNSLSIFRFRAFYPLMLDTCMRLLYGIHQTVTLFWWILLIDALMSIGVAKILLTSTTKNPQTGSLAEFIIPICWLVLRSTFLLFVRDRSDQLTTLDYVKKYFVRCIQMSLVFSLISLIIIAIIVGLGVTTLPKASLWFIMIAEFLMILTTFFWLELPGSAKDILISLERGANLLIYNIPIFAFMITIASIFLYGITHLVTLMSGTLEPQPLTDMCINYLKTLPLWSAIGLVLLTKYLVVIGEYLMISMVYCYFKQKRNKHYSHSYFE